MNTGPSPEYLAAIEEGRRHHLSSKTYSGSFLRPHKNFLDLIIQKHGCKTALDVGAGKCAQYEWIDPGDGKTMEQAWGIPVRKYDPCWPPIASEPRGKFDLVICSHTLHLIPKTDLDWWTQRLFGFANKVVFIAEKIQPGPRKKGEIGDPENRAIGWAALEWIAFLDRHVGGPSHPDLLVFSAREITDRGKIVTRHYWEKGVYKGGFEAGHQGVE